MNDCSYLLIYSDGILDVEQETSAIGKATLSLAASLVRRGENVVVAASLRNQSDLERDNIQFWHLGKKIDINIALKRIHQFSKAYHCFCASYFWPLLDKDKCCLSRMLLGQCDETLLAYDIHAACLSFEHVNKQFEVALMLDDLNDLEYFTFLTSEKYLVLAEKGCMQAKNDTKSDNVISCWSDCEYDEALSYIKSSGCQNLYIACHAFDKYVPDSFINVVKSASEIGVKIYFICGSEYGLNESVKKILPFVENIFIIHTNDKISFVQSKDFKMILSKTYTALISNEQKQVFNKQYSNEVEHKVIQEKLKEDVESLQITDSVPIISFINRKLRVLLQNRRLSDVLCGGDVVLTNVLLRTLPMFGVDVDLDSTGEADLTQYDIVHIFNFVLPKFIDLRARQACEAGVPFVVTTLNEDWPSFLNQGGVYAHCLEEYVRNGQNISRIDYNYNSYINITKSGSLDDTFAVHHAKMLFTTGKNESDVLRRIYGNLKNIRTIKLGAANAAMGDPSLFEKEYHLKDFVLCVGRLEGRKNQLMLLKALENVDIPVVLATGKCCYDPNYAEAVQSFRRKGQTLCLGYLTTEMLTSAYAAARVHVLPSWYELPGLVSLEAGANRCQVVASTFGTIEEYLGDSAFYCKPYDENSIREAVLEAYRTPFKEELFTKCRSYSWMEYAKNTYLAYQDVLKELHNNKSAGVGDKNNGSLNVVTDNYDENKFLEFVEKGESKAKEKDFVSARKYLDEAEKIFNRSARLCRARAAIFLAENNAFMATKWFSDATFYEPNDARGWCGIGMCQVQMEKYEEAYQTFMHTLSLDSEQMVAILQLMECAYKLNKYDELAKILRSFVENHPDNIDMKYCYAGVLYKLNDILEVEKVLTEILAVNAEHLGAKQLFETIKKDREIKNEIVNIGTSDSEVKVETISNACINEDKSSSEKFGVDVQPQFCNEGKQDSRRESSSKTLEELSTRIEEVVLKLDQGKKHDQICEDESDILKNNEIINELVNLENLKKDHEFDAVIEGCEKVLANAAINSENKEHAQLLEAETYILLNRRFEAAELYQEIIKTNPDSSRCLSGQGVLAILNTDWQVAEECFVAAIEKDKRNDVAIAGLGTCAVQNQKFEKAWEYFNDALSYNSENVRALLGAIDLGYKLKRFAEMEELIKNYLAMHPCNLEFTYSLAGCYFVQNRLEEALSEVNKITLFEPDNERALELKQIIDEKLALNL